MRAKRLTYSQVEFLCEQLAMILGSGMSVSEGLGLLCADSDDRVLVSACNEISSGAALAGYAKHRAIP